MMKGVGKRREKRGEREIRNEKRKREVVME